MAQEWTMEAARALLHQWNRRKVEGAVRVGGLSVDLDAVEAWLLDQKPASLAEAERLLDLIVAHQAGVDGDLTMVGTLQANGQVTWVCGSTGTTIPSKYRPASCQGT